MSDFIVEKIKINGETTLHGQLEYNNSSLKKDVIIFIHGSGESDRDGIIKFKGKEISRNFELLSKEFVAIGFKVFRYDKSNAYNIEKTIKNAIRVIKYIKQRNDIDRIFIYAWSEGVRVTANILKQEIDINGLILQSGIAKGWGSYFDYILIELVTNQLYIFDQDDDGIVTIDDIKNYEFDASSVSFALSTLLLTQDKCGNLMFNKRISKHSSKSINISKEWLPIARAISQNPNELDRFIDNPGIEKWDGDLEIFKKYENPILLIHGINDGWVSPKQAIEFAKVMNKDLELALITGVGHSLQETDSPLKDTGGVMSQKAIDKIKAWLLDK